MTSPFVFICVMLCFVDEKRVQKKRISAEMIEIYISALLLSKDGVFIALFETQIDFCEVA